MKKRLFLLLSLIGPVLVIPLGGYGQDSLSNNDRPGRNDLQENIPVQVAHTPGISDYDVKWYFINLQVNDTNTFIRGSAQVWVRVLSDSLPGMVLQLTDSLQVDSVYVNGKKSGFQHQSDTLLITISPSPVRDEQVRTRIFYHGTVPSGGFFSAMTSKEDPQWHQRVTWTLSEPYAARDWFPCKQDLGDKADSCAVWITVEKGLVAGSNGLLAGVDTLKEGQQLRYRWHHHHPIDYYLISLAVSGYRTYDLYAHPKGYSDSILIRNLIYEDPEYLHAEKENIDWVVPALELYSRIYGIYPYADEKYGHCLAPMGGGMEHQTMTTLAGFGFNMVVHELAHQWFGDHVTCATWQDIWINEGFASYSEYVSLENLKSKKEASDWMQVAHSRALKEPNGSVYVPFEELNNMNRIFNYNLSYKKGASILHMIRYELNDDSLFFGVLRSFQQAYADSVATGMDFEKILEAHSGKDFSDFFHQWYFGTGYPRYAISWYQNQDSLYIQSVQTPSGSTPLFKMHMDFRIQTGEGDTLIRVYQDRNNQLFACPIKEPVWQVLPDPDGWLLIKVLSVTHVITTKVNVQDVAVYPNPSTGLISVYTPFSVPALKISILNMSGENIRTYRLNRTPYQVGVSTLSEGMYILQITTGHKKWVKKLVIRK